MRVDDYELEVFTPPCKPGAERYSAVAHLPHSIAEVLPYLNATLTGANYIPSANALTWKRADHLVAFHADRVAVSNVIDREEAANELDRMIDLVNRTWAQRADIKPNFQAKKRPPPMAIFQQLPKTNCRECGQATCMAFAFSLSKGDCTIVECPRLTSEQWTALETLFS